MSLQSVAHNLIKRAKRVKRERSRIWWQIGILVLITCMAVYAGIRFNDEMDKFWTEPRTLASTFNKKPSGLTGLVEISRRSGLSCKAWQSPYRRLSAIKGMLVITHPSESLADFEAEQILSWVKAGNDLVYLDHFAYKFTRRLLTRLNLDIKEGGAINDKLVFVENATPEFSHVNHLLVSSETRVIGGRKLLSLADGNLLVEVKHGKGRALIGTTPSLCSNMRLSDKRSWCNFQFLVNWFHTSNGDIWFDERSHGFTDSNNVFLFLVKGNTGLVLAQLCLLLCIAVISGWQRFGQVKVVTQKRKISNLEFIFGLANAYRRAKASTLALEVIVQAFKHRLCKLLAISPYDSKEKIVEALGLLPLAKKSLNSEELLVFFSDYEKAMASGELSESELKVLVSTCDKILDQSKTLFATSEKQ